MSAMHLLREGANGEPQRLPVRSFVMIDERTMARLPTPAMKAAFFGLCRCAAREYEATCQNKDIIAAACEVDPDAEVDPETGRPIPLRPIGVATIERMLNWLLKRGLIERRLHDPRIAGGRRLTFLWRRAGHDRISPKEFREDRQSRGVVSSIERGGVVNREGTARAPDGSSYKRGQKEREGAPSASAGVGETPPPPPARGEPDQRGAPPEPSAPPPPEPESEADGWRSLLGGPLDRVARARLAELGEVVAPPPPLPSNEELLAATIAGHGIAPPKPSAGPRPGPGMLAAAAEAIAPPRRPSFEDQARRREEQIRQLRERAARAVSDVPPPKGPRRAKKGRPAGNPAKKPRRPAPENHR